jgi:aminoglycoside phosphotransferase (APT) family kinase protein
MTAATQTAAPDVDAVARFLCKACDTNTVRVNTIALLSGGAIQQNWKLDVEITGGPRAGTHTWVLRTDAEATVQASSARDREFAVLQFAHNHKLLAPRPLYLCDDISVTGRPFFIMESLPGVAAGHIVTRDAKLVTDRRDLARQLAVALARIHAVCPAPNELPFLHTYCARERIAALRAYLDTLGEPHPVLEWGLRWCERQAPAHEETTFVHGDFRTGNYLVENNTVTGLLDWEFAAWGNPLEDVAWICAKCWRFRKNHYVVGGVADLIDFIPPYEAASGRKVKAIDLHYWQVMAHIRWSIIALQQAQRYLVDGELSLELALTGKIVAELEWEILQLTEQTKSQ